MKLTPLYQKHLELGAKMYKTGTGYQMPAYYKDANEESLIVRRNAGMIDLSLMSRFDLKGKDALALTQKLIVNNAARLQDGQALYTTMCNERGLIEDDVVVMRFGPQHFRIITSSMFRRKTPIWIAKHSQGLDVQFTDVSSGLAMIGLQGPKSRDILRRITDIDLDRLGFFRFAEGTLNGKWCLIARLGFSGELGYEVYFNVEDGVEGWNDIAAAGAPFGITPYGMDTLDILRLEKGFIFFGYDVTDQNNPYECGLWPLIRYDAGDFLGRDALLAVKERGPAKKLMGLEFEAGTARIPAAGASLAHESGVAGRVVMGFHSPSLGRNLAYAYLDAPHFAAGNQVTLDIEGARVKATVVDMPFVDVEGKRMRS